MGIDARILRDTLEATLALDDTFPARFYELLYAEHPSVRALFRRNSMGAQHKMFAQKLVAIVDHIEDPSWLERELGKLAEVHRSYGVTEEMYPWVGDALVTTLREACGDEWSEAAEESWRAAYAALKDAILAKSSR
jgi:hemoglobin-like flavoprotein